jgi:alcohol dehydrogenase (cytochrome c)
MAKWAYQFTPHDQWDYDGVNENLLLDITFEGKPRKVLLHFDRNAFAYTIDRTTGEVLKAEPFAYQNWSSGIDLKTGMPKVVPEMQPRPNVKLQKVCPPDIGGKDWQPASFSPRTGLVYAGIFNLCMDLTDHPQSYIPGTPYDGMEMKRFPAPGGNWGEFMAWDPVAGKKVWAIKEHFLTMSGTLATAGDLVFYGTADGWFRAVDARSGKVLWSYKLGSGVIGQPMTYLGPDKRQYIAIYSGIGGAAMLNKNEKGFPPRGGTLYVFSIDGVSPHSAAGMLETEAGGAATQSGMTIGGKP